MGFYFINGNSKRCKHIEMKKERKKKTKTLKKRERECYEKKATANCDIQSVYTLCDCLAASNSIIAVYIVYTIYKYCKSVCFPFVRIINIVFQLI